MKNNNNNNFTKQSVKGPVFSITTPGPLNIYQPAQPTGSTNLPGESPYNEGSVVNHVNNVNTNKEPIVDTVDSTELFSPMFVQFKNVSMNPGGIKFELNNAGNDYVTNTAFNQANLAAIQARQNLSIKQLTQLNFYSSPSPLIQNSYVQPITIAGLAVSDVTMHICTYLWKQAELFAFMKEMVTIDKINMRFYQEMQRQMSRSRYVTSLTLIDTVIRSLYIDTTTLNYLDSVIKVCRSSDSLNGIMTRLDILLKDKTKVLSIYPTTPKSGTTSVAQSLTINLSDYCSFIDMEKFFDCAKQFVNSTNNEFTYSYKDPVSGNVGTIKTPREFVSKLEEYNNAVNTIIMNHLNVMANYYAAYEVIQTTGITSSNFVKGVSLMPSFAKKLNVEYSTKHLGMYQVATAVADMDMKKDDVNNISLSVPTVRDYVPYSIYSNNSILLWLRGVSDNYLPILEWTDMQIRDMTTWTKATKDIITDPTGVNFMKLPITNTTANGDYIAVNLSNLNSTDEVTARYTRLAYWASLRFQLWTTKWASWVAEDANKSRTVISQWSPVITNWLRFSYKTIDHKVINTAPNAVGLKNVNPVGSFYA